MAKYRSIHQKIWKDPDFQAYSPESKLVFIYLCTNGSTSESGIYAITPKTIANETGINFESVTQIVEKLKNVIFDAKTNYVYVRRFKLYNGGGRDDLVKKAIVSEFLLSGDSKLWTTFVEDYPLFKELITAAGKNLPPRPPITISNSNSISNSKEPLAKGSPTVGQPLVKGLVIPDFIKKETWDNFLEMRRKMKATPTEHAKNLLIKKLEELRSAGNDPNLVLERSTMNNWKGIFALEGNENNGTAKKLSPRSLPTKYHTPEEVISGSSTQANGLPASGN